ncbi:MAG TPA: hypothetical protein P5509_04650, partial [Bacteroidales bacterium]|nr:hypothetical protein [Bacteroidales bacterium]
MNKKFIDLEGGKFRILPTDTDAEKSWKKIVLNSTYGTFNHRAKPDAIDAYMAMVGYCKLDVEFTKEIHERMNPQKQPLIIPTDSLLLV